jgi:aspartate aminotransferase
MAVQPSATMAVEGRVQEMRRAGENVIGFGAGEPDFPTPDAIKDAGIEAISSNFSKYTATGGMPQLKEAIAKRVSVEQGLEFKPGQVCVHNGGKESIYLATQAILEKGDECLIAGPFWVSYLEMVRLADAEPVLITTTAKDNFKVTRAMLDAHTTPRTKLFLLNSPSNPTGMVYSAAEMGVIADWARANPQIVVLTDELYDRIVFTPTYARWLKIAPDLADRTIVVNGLSKAYSMTGWRLGYAAGPDAYIKGMLKIQSHSTSHPSSITQAAALFAYTHDLDAEIEKMRVEFQKRRDWIVPALNAIPGVNCVMPEGAFYAFPDFSGLLGKPLKSGITLASSEALTMYLLDKAKVGIVHGEAFGAPGCARMSYALALAKIQEGVGRIAEALAL